MKGPSTFEDLTAVIALCFGTAGVDGNFDDVEAKAILGGLRAQYNFEGKDDLLMDYIKAAHEMSYEEAIDRVTKLDAEPKQFASDMLFLTIASDGKLAPEEESVYKNLLSACGLPLFSGYDKL